MSETHRPQGYPRIDAQKNGEYAVDDAVEGTEYSTMALFVTAAVPAANTAFGLTPYTSAKLKTYKVERRSDTDIWLAYLHYETAGYAAEKASGDQPEETVGSWLSHLEDSGLVMPLAAADGTITPTAYLKKWDFDLYSNSTTVPAFFGTANGTHMMTDAEAQNYQWAQQEVERPTDQGILTRWHPVGRRTKPGVTDFITSAPLIVETKNWLAQAAGAEAAWISAVTAFTGKVGRTAAPNQNFGLSTGEFIIRAVSSSNSGKYLSLTVSYQWSKIAWDNDLYT